MNPKYLVIIFLFITTFSYAQEPADALRYSYLTQSGGTARNQAIGGAGASLGGEFSSLFINPAGLGFYKTGDFVFTPGYVFKTDKSNYLNSNDKATRNNFNLGATGLLFSSPTSGKGIKSFTIGIGISRSADFNNHIYYKGVNHNTSYSEKYLEELVNGNVTDPNNAAKNYPYGSSLALNTYLINPTYNADSSAVTGYSSLASPAFGLNQENTINTTGGITDLAVGAGLNLKDKWFFGGTLSFPFLNYNRDASYKESDASGNTNNNFNYFEANESLQTKGVGVNGKFGVIYKPIEYVRLGLAIHTPTFYQLTDNYTSTVITDLEGYGGAGIKKQSSTDLTNGQPLQSKYNLNTPWRIMASGSYVFREVENVQQQRAFITADVEYVNYKGMSFHAADNSSDSKDYYSSLNTTIANLYKNAINVRLGGEIKFNTVMFRLGGAYYGNPYKNESSDIVKLSGGVGYRAHGMFIDLTYVYSLDKDVHYPYLLTDKPNSAAYLKNNAGNIVATIGFKI
ncbi:MAG: outer membrane protein transport protein [Bacteroidota bacterium]|nr:outer membrane protein transport protein [Bacteroidota bacterium]